MTDQPLRTQTASEPAPRSSLRSRIAALCAVALVCVSGSLLMQVASNSRLAAAPMSVSWVFGPPGSISVR